MNIKFITVPGVGGGCLFRNRLPFFSPPRTIPRASARQPITHGPQTIRFTRRADIFRSLRDELDDNGENWICLKMADDVRRKSPNVRPITTPEDIHPYVCAHCVVYFCICIQTGLGVSRTSLRVNRLIIQISDASYSISFKRKKIAQTYILIAFINVSSSCNTCSENICINHAAREPISFAECPGNCTVSECVTFTAVKP